MALPWQTRDGRLVDRVRNGDPQAFEQIYARYQPEILSFCRHLTGQREDAEDAVQHTFLSAYSQIVESEGKVELRPWLFAVARNRCLSLLRARGVRGAEPLTDSARSVDGLASEVERRQELRDLVADVGRLPEPQRAALLLSQMDSMSHREIGAVLGIEPEKVKALVFQARSSLLATREAREAPCSDVRSELTTSRGAALRRRTLRRHIHECQGCREFETAVLRQRHNLDVLLPVIPTAGLHRAVLDVLGTRDGASTAAGAGAVAAGSTGASGGGLGGSLVALGTQGVAKLAVVGVVATGGVTGAVAADLPAQIRGAAPAGQQEAVARHDTVGGGVGGAPAAGNGDSADEPSPKARRREDNRDHAQDEDRGGRDREIAPSDEPPDSGPGGSGEETGGGGDLPPGLAKKDELPPGLAKKDELPPGLAKKEGSAQGKTGKVPPGQAKAPGSESGGGQGNAGGNGGGQGNGGGNGGAGGNGQGNGNGGNGGGRGNGGGNAGGNGNGNGGGNGH